MAAFRVFVLTSLVILNWSLNGYSVTSPVGDPGPSIALQVIDGRPVVDGVLVNGHGPYRFLVDTGSNVDLIETGLAAAIELEPNYLNELSSGGGTVAVSGSAGNDIRLGSLTAGRQLFIFSDLQAIHHLSSDIRGVLGQPFLSRFDYLLDLRNKRIEFGTVNWGGSRVPFTMLNARPTIQTNLGMLVLDSGTKSVLLFGVQSENPSVSLRTLSGSVDTGTVHRKVTVGNRDVWQGEAVAVPRRANESGDGLLPLTVFRTVYVCNSEGFIGFN